MGRPSITSAPTRLATGVATGALCLLALAAPVGATNSPNLVRDINPAGNSFPTSLTQVGSTLFFAANDGVHGAELWKSDGTAAGTKMVKNIRPYGKSSSPENLVNVNGKLFFTAKDGKHGRELWKSDGTKAGTVMVKDIVPEPAQPYVGDSIFVHERLMAIGNSVYFFNDPLYGDESQLWVSNGTAAGTRELAGDQGLIVPGSWGEEWWRDGMTSLGAASGKFYFVAEDAEGSPGYRLWVSDGTEAGTHRVAGGPSSQAMSIFPVNGQKLYFYDGARLWRTDGTAAGTKPLTSSTALSSAPTESAFMNSRLYFNGGALWRTDGSLSGTKIISTGEANGLTVAGNRVFFVRGSHLWKTDGTAAGTIDMGTFGAFSPRAIAAVGTKVCFVEADWDNATWTLWKSDGTVAGTYQVASFAILGGGFSTGDGPIGTAVGSKLFFSASDGVHGAELWSYIP